jgi:hypothetical protein
MMLAETWRIAEGSQGAYGRRLRLGCEKSGPETPVWLVSIGHCEGTEYRAGGCLAALVPIGVTITTPNGLSVPPRWGRFLGALICTRHRIISAWRVRELCGGGSVSMKTRNR